MIQFITHANDRYGYVDGAEMALKGGCRWIQLRMKEASDNEVLSAGMRIKKMCDAFHAKLIIDDRVNLVKALQADGVHLGKNDMPPGEARRILGKEAIIGGTANTYDDVKRISGQGADYIGCGPFRFTATKKNLSPVLGLEGYRSIIASMKKDGISLPVIAIGGILIEDVDGIMETGVSGIAISGAILNSASPVEETELFVRAERRYTAQ